MASASACRLQMDVVYWQLAVVAAARNLQYHLKQDTNKKARFETELFYFPREQMAYSATLTSQPEITSP